MSLLASRGHAGTLTAVDAVLRYVNAKSVEAGPTEVLELVLDQSAGSFVGVATSPFLRNAQKLQLVGDEAREAAPGGSDQPTEELWAQCRHMMDVDVLDLSFGDPEAASLCWQLDYLPP
ncbi:hypothetical protein DFJ74DRAFT_704432 [Hyaloraphidium curvatum]|nr:hypothetical protein DFJ74DRAFT_704432 [Hyaloraphidium curvatum]